jgi:hypothetical protein
MMTVTVTIKMRIKTMTQLSENTKFCHNINTLSHIIIQRDVCEDVEGMWR